MPRCYEGDSPSISGKAGALGALDPERRALDDVLGLLEVGHASPTGFSADGGLDYGVPIPPDADPPYDAILLDPGEDEWARGANPYAGIRPYDPKPTWENANVAQALLAADPGSPLPNEDEAL